MCLRLKAPKLFHCSSSIQSRQSEFRRRLQILEEPLAHLILLLENFIEIVMAAAAPLGGMRFAEVLQVANECSLC